MGSIRRAIAIGTLVVGIVTAMASAAGHRTGGPASADSGAPVAVVTVDTPWE